MFFVFLTLLTLAACGEDKNADIVTTMFPQYDFARAIAGDKLSVSLLTPPGVEPHEFEATSKDMIAIREAKLFIITSLVIDNWINDLSSVGGQDTIVLDLSQSYDLSLHDVDHEHEDEHDDHDEDLHDDDHDDDHDDHDHETLHYWTDPVIALHLVDAILEKIIEIDPENSLYYTENAQNYKEALDQLHHEIESFFEDPLYHDSAIFFAGHNALGSFGARYDLTITSLFPNFIPDEDLTSAQLTNFITLVKNAEITYLFIEELVEPRAAQTIVSELEKDGVTLTLLEFHGYHNLTALDMANGVTYIDLLQRNFDHLKLVLIPQEG